MVVRLVVFLLFLFGNASSIFSDAYVDMRFIMSAEKECIFFQLHQPHSRMDVSVTTMNSEYPLSVELFNPSGVSEMRTSNSGNNYFKYPQSEGSFHEVGDFQLCMTSYVRQAIQVNLIMVIYEKNANNIDVASNLKRIKSGAYDATQMTLQNFERITLNIDEKLKLVKTEQAKRAFVEKIDRSHIETAFEMINFWHIMRVFLVVILTFLQVHTIRRFLSVK